MKKNNSLQAKEFISIDVGTHSTKITAGKNEKDRLILTHAFTVKTPPNSFKDGYISDVEKLKETLEPAIKYNNVKAKQAVCTVESTSIITREINIPAVKPDQMKRLLAFEIQQYLPIEIDQYIIQYKVLEEIKEENTTKLNVLVTALPKNIAESFLALIEGMHLKPAALDIHSNVVDKLFNGSVTVNNTEPLMDKTAAVIDIGYSSINITILDRGLFKFNRLLNIGSRNLDVNIANFLNLSLENGEKRKFEIKNPINLSDEYAINSELLNLGKQEAAVAKEDEDEYTASLRLSNIVKNSINDWIENIEKVFKYYTSRSTGNTIDIIYLYGGSSSLAGLAQYFQESFNIHSLKVHSLSNVDTKNLNGDFDICTYINSIGTIIRR